MMLRGIATGGVGKIHGQTMLFCCQNKRGLALVRFAAKPPGSKKETEFERHIESRQIVFATKLYARQVVDRLLTFRDQPAEFVEPDIGGVDLF